MKMKTANKRQRQRAKKWHEIKFRLRALQSNLVYRNGLNDFLPFFCVHFCRISFVVRKKFFDCRSRLRFHLSDFSVSALQLCRSLKLARFPKDGTNAKALTCRDKQITSTWIIWLFFCLILPFVRYRFVFDDDGHFRCHCRHAKINLNECQIDYAHVRVEDTKTPTEKLFDAKAFVPAMHFCIIANDRIPCDTESLFLLIIMATTHH